MDSETIDSAVGLRRHEHAGTAGRTCTFTERGLNPSTLLLVYGGVYWLREPESHRPNLTYENRPSPRSSRRKLRAAERIRTSTGWPLEPPTLPLVYGGMTNTSWERWDLHPVVLMALDLQSSSVSLPSTFPGYPGCPRVLGERRDLHPLVRGPHPRASSDFGLAHSPPGGNRTLTDRLSGDCTTVVLQAGIL